MSPATPVLAAATLATFLALTTTARADDTHRATPPAGQAGKATTAKTPPASTDSAEAAKTGPKAIYVCPMHPEVTSDKEGRCPKCKMVLERKKETKATYVCPMHAEVTSDKEGRCPKCKMALERKAEPKDETKK